MRAVLIAFLAFVLLLPRLARCGSPAAGDDGSSTLVPPQELSPSR
jgi:hypothetical protein